MFMFAILAVSAASVLAVHQRSTSPNEPPAVIETSSPAIDEAEAKKLAYVYCDYENRFAYRFSSLVDDPSSTVLTPPRDSSTGKSQA